jgi:hypothetical protein
MLHTLRVHGIEQIPGASRHSPETRSTSCYNRLTSRALLRGIPCGLRQTRSPDKGYLY